MKYTRFSLNRCTSLIIAAALILTSPLAYGQSFVEGEDYVTLQGDAVVLPDGRVEVIEFFWFGCPTCYRFEPILLAWDKPETISFKTVPAILNRASEFHAHAYYAMELLNLEGQLMQPFYDELHVKRNRVVNAEDFEAWASTQSGVDAAKLATTTHSFAAMTKVRQADLLAEKYSISGVPTIVVGGKYRTSPALADSFIHTLEIVEFLVEKVLAGQ